MIGAKLAQIPFNVAMLNMASALMLFFPIAIDVLIVITWVSLGIFENSWSLINFWIILFCWVLTFIQYLLSALIFGAAKRLNTEPETDWKYLGIIDRASDTIDLGWDLTFKTALGCLAVTLSMVTAFALFFFHDIVFVVGLYRGMETQQENEYPQAIQWFKKCVHVAGAERVSVARFLLAGAYMQSGDSADGIEQLNKAVEENKASPRPNSTLLLFFYSALSDAQQRTGDWSGVEKNSQQALNLFRTVKVFPEVEVRLIGDLKNFSLPEAPTISTALHGLEKSYLKQGKNDQAVEMFRQILSEHERLRTPEFVYKEIYYFQWQMLGTADSERAFLSAVDFGFGRACKDLSDVKDKQTFLAGYQAFRAKMDKRREESMNPAPSPKLPDAKLPEAKPANLKPADAKPAP